MRRLAAAVVATAVLAGAGASLAFASEGTEAALTAVCAAEGGTFSSFGTSWLCEGPDVTHPTLTTRPTLPLRLCRSTLGRRAFFSYRSSLVSEPYYWECTARDPA